MQACCLSTSDAHLGGMQALRESGERLAKLAAELSSRTSGDKAQQSMETGLANELIDLGIISPVTKGSAGKQYHQELSRELAKFLQQQLRKETGMMVLHDVFCLFNRCWMLPSHKGQGGILHCSCVVFVVGVPHLVHQPYLSSAGGRNRHRTCRARGMELVSPDDLRAAAELFESLSLPVSLRVFPSGVAVVQDESWSDDAVCSNIIDILDATQSGRHTALGRGIAPTQYALEAAVPLAVAVEQLLLAERKGFLCRDDTACGLFFFRNFFLET